MTPGIHAWCCSFHIHRGGRWVSVNPELVKAMLHFWSKRSWILRLRMVTASERGRERDEQEADYDHDALL